MTAKTYDPELCEEKHRSLNKRMNMLFWILGVILAWFVGLSIYVSNLPKQAPPEWFLQQVKKLEGSQEDLEDIVLENQRAIIQNNEQLKNNAEMLGRLEDMLRKMNGGN